MDEARLKEKLKETFAIGKRLVEAVKEARKE
jgi:hypothetical protein